MVRRNTKLMDFKIDDTIMKAFMLLVQVTDAIHKYAEIRFYRSGLSEIKFLTLLVLHKNGGTMTPSDIARWTFRERHDITTLVRRLERDGLVTSERGTVDRRFVYITLTKKGRKVYEQTMPTALDIEAQLMTSISEKQALALSKILDVICHNTERAMEQTEESAQK